MEYIVNCAWPDWRLESPLGMGSYGIVYRAVHARDPGRLAAIKIISIPGSAAEWEALRADGLSEEQAKAYLGELVQDFISEIRVMELLRGEAHIVRVEEYAVVEKQDGIGWDIHIRMEYLTPFNTYICDKRMSEADVIRLGCDLCSALIVCEKHRVLHRDIKPENILVDGMGQYKLGDFGIARKLEQMTFGLSQKGTVNYMAPEVLYSSDYNAGVDIYSLGLVLYRLLNRNRMPFLDTEKQLLSPQERRSAVDCRLRGDPLPPPCQASAAVAAVILKACEYDPNHRYASASEMREALLQAAQAIGEDPARIGGTRSAPAAASAARQSKTPPTRRRKTAAILAWMLCCVLAVGAAGFALVRSRYVPEAGHTSGIEAEWIGLEVYRLPVLCEYTVGDPMEAEGLTLLMVFDDGTVEVVDSGFTVSPDIFWQAGEQTVTVTYGDMQTEFTVSVSEERG